MHFRRFAVLGAALAVVLGMAPGVAQAKTKPPAVLQARTGTAVTLADAGGTEKTVESLTLPRGSWTVTSDVTAINFGAGDFLRCQLQENGSLFDGGQTVFLADRVSGLANAGTVVLSAAGTVAVVCDHDHAAASSGQFYIDPGATLTAVDGGPIDGPGMAVTSKAAVVEGRTTASTDLSNNGNVAVLSITLPKGAWAITVNASAVDFSDPDAVVCYVTVSGDKGAIAFANAGVNGSDAAATGLDLEGDAKVKTKTAFAVLVCYTLAGDSTYLDAGVTVTATKVSPAAVEAGQAQQTALPDAAGGSAIVVTMTVPAGAWRVRSSIMVGHDDASGNVDTGQDFVRCGLKANGNAIDGGATEFIKTDSYLQMLVNAGTFTATAPWTLTLTCSHDAQDTSGGSWGAGPGILTAVNKGPIG